MSDGGVSKTLNNRATDADHVPCVLIRGGQTAYGFVPRESGKARSIGYGREVLPTMSADANYAVLVLNDKGGGRDECQLR